MKGELISPESYLTGQVKKQKGFTLIETLIYIGIFSIVALSLSGILWNTLRINSNQQAANEVDENLRYVLSVLNEKVRGSIAIDSASSSTLVLKNGSYTNTTFSVTGGVLYLQEGAGTPIAVTSNKVVVDSLVFTKIEMSGAKDGVSVDITLSYNSDKPELAFTKNLISMVNRVAAITFDSDILPDTDNLYSVGSSNPRWKNGYFSGDLSVGGNGTITGDLTVDTNTLYVNSASNYVGIGTASPGSKLDVNGNITQSVTHGNNIKLWLSAARNGGGTGEVGLYSWISEPGMTWTGGGVARNMYNATNWPRINIGLSGQMMHFTESGNVEFTLETAAGARSTPLAITNAGKVGIRTTTPAYALDVVGDINFSGKLREDGVEIFSGAIAMFAMTCPTGWTRFSALDNNFARGAATYGGTGGASTHVHSVDPPSTTSSIPSIQNYSEGTGASVLSSENHTHTTDIVAFNSAAGSSLPPYLDMVFCQKNAGSDLAEWTLAKEKYEPATLVSLDSSTVKTVKASDKAYDSAVAGIVSTEPGWILGKETSEKVLLALSGQVPLKVSTINGLIKIGDPITTSDISGSGMKATEAGTIVAKAMEDFDPNNSEQIIPCPKGAPDEVVCGKIMVLINVSWYGGDGSDSIIGNFVEKVKNALASLGIWVENQIIKVKELVAEKILVRKIRVEQLEMVDKETGEIYCTWIENGEWLKNNEECK